MDEKQNGSKKIAIFDTSVLIHNSKAFLYLENSEIVIPIKVLQELKGLSQGQRKVRRRARQALKVLYDCGSEKDLINGGVLLPNGCKLRLLSSSRVYFKNRSADNRILSLAVELLKKGNCSVTLFSRDRGLRLKALSKNIPAYANTLSALKP